MPIIRKLIAQNENDCNQWLKVDHASRYIVNDTPDWQFLFGPNSSLNNGAQILKLAAEFDTITLNKIRMIGYLYNPVTGNVDSSASVQFNIYKVTDNGTPRWDDQLLTTINGTLQSNNYFFNDILISSLTGTSLDGDTTLMIEGIATRLGITYRDRIYVNHLGVYESIISLRNEVDFLGITKKDL